MLRAGAPGGRRLLRGRAGVAIVVAASETLGRARRDRRVPAPRCRASAYPVGGWLVYTVGSPCTIHTFGVSIGRNDRSPPGSRVVGTVSPLGRCMMKFTGFVSSTSGMLYSVQPPSLRVSGHG